MRPPAKNQGHVASEAIISTADLRTAVQIMLQNNQLWKILNIFAYSDIVKPIHPRKMTPFLLQFLVLRQISSQIHPGNTDHY